jgi:hypothetical protein
MNTETFLICIEVLSINLGMLGGYLRRGGERLGKRLLIDTYISSLRGQVFNWTGTILNYEMLSSIMT